MATLNKVLGAYLVLTALAVAVLLIVTPIIHDGSSDYDNWKIMNYFMVAGVIIALVANFICKRKQDAEGAENLGVSLAFYGAVALTMLFFWEWFWTLFPDNETGDAALSHMVYFPLVDALYTVIGLSTGKALWRASEG